MFFFNLDKCVNWFGNDLDWSMIPFTRRGNTPWGYTPEGCNTAVMEYGEYDCAVETKEGIRSCFGDCQDGKCVDNTPGITIEYK